MSPRALTDRSRRSCASALLIALLALSPVPPARAAGGPVKASAGATPSATAPAPSGTPSPAADAAPDPAAPAAASHVPPGVPGLPVWSPPDQYSVDMVCTHEGQEITMKRAISGKRIRTDLVMDDQTMTMIELGDEDGTTITLMPEQKQAMQMSQRSMLEASKHVEGAKQVEAKQVQAKQGEQAKAAAGNEPRVERVGQETVDGRVCDKYRCDYGGQVGFTWIDPATKFPVRMESGGAVMEWKNYVVAPQPAKLFEVPKGYTVMNMDDMMKSMGGMPSMSGMANHMAGSFGQQMGSQFGTSLGSSLGAAFGGPLGAMAGGYLGGKVGGLLGKKTAEAITPGK